MRFDSGDKIGPPSDKQLLNHQYSALRQNLFDQLFAGASPSSEKIRPAVNLRHEQESTKLARHESCEPQAKPDAQGHQPYFQLDASSTRSRREQESDWLEKMREQHRKQQEAGDSVVKLPPNGRYGKNGVVVYDSSRDQALVQQGVLPVADRLLQSLQLAQAASVSPQPNLQDAGTINAKQLEIIAQNYTAEYSL